MNKLEKWSLLLLAYSLILSFFRHSLWAGFNPICLILGLFENVVIILAFLPLFYLHKQIVKPFEDCDTKWYYFASNIPLGIWFVYASLCNAYKLFLLTSLTN